MVPGEPLLCYHVAQYFILTDDAFFNRTRLERVGFVGPEPGLLWTGLKTLDRRA